MARREQVLYRDSDDEMIGGVCSGLGHYFDIDTSLVRVAFAVLAMVGGGGILGYVILWAVLDPAPTGYWDQIETETETVIETGQAGPAPEVIDVTAPQSVESAAT